MTRTLGTLLTLSLLVPAMSGAQTPWIVTVTPTMNPLPVGTCGAVWLKVIDPKIRDIPRNPSGTPVSIADFDLTVTTPDGKSAIGQYADSFHWSVCACQGATTGTAATITAKYPGQLLTERTRVPEIVQQTTVDFSLAPAKSSWNPPGCPAPPPTAVSVAAGTPITPPQPPASPKTVITAPTKAGSASSGGATAPPSAAPALPPGPAPAGVTVTGTPTSVTLTWQPVAGVASYVVTRHQANGPTTQTLAPTNQGMYDSGLQPATAYTWTIRAIQVDGREGSTDVAFITPVYPTGFGVQQQGPGRVLLTWDMVKTQMASGDPREGYPTGYRVMGSGRPAGGTWVAAGIPWLTNTPYLQISNLADATYSWQVLAEYGGGGSYETAGMPSASITLTTAPPSAISLTPPLTASLSPRFRVSILGFIAMVETNDDLLSRDGKNNEVYAAATVCDGVRRAPTIPGVYNPPIVTCNLIRSAVHGDVNLFPGRIQAGTGSASGGITSGNSVGAGPGGTTAGSTSTFPFVLWQGTLLPGAEAVWIAPSLWESGGRDLELQAWNARTQGNLHFTQFGPSTQALDGGFVPLNTSEVQRCAYMEPGEDRPIGLAPPENPSSSYSRPALICYVIGLTREKAEAVLGAAPQEAGKPVGVLTMDLPDHVSGHYLMYLKLERLP